MCQRDTRRWVSLSLDQTTKSSLIKDLHELLQSGVDVALTAPRGPPFQSFRNVVWGTLADWTDTSYVVWGTQLQDPSGQYVVWGTSFDGDYVVWGTTVVPDEPSPFAGVESTFTVSEVFAFSAVLLFGPEAGAVTLASDSLVLA